MVKRQKILFIPGGGVSPKASKKVLDEYRRLLGSEIELLPYPEFVRKNFTVNLENYKEYFVAQARKFSDSDTIVVGYSLGAFFALDLAGKKDMPIKSVILISPFLKKPNDFLSLFWHRTISNIQYENRGKMFAYPVLDIIIDTLKYGRKFVQQYRQIVSRLTFDEKMANSDARKVLIMGNRDKVMPLLEQSEINMKNSKLFRINGNHDILTNQHLEVCSIIRKYL
jgi:pimeloyl-ACP methyl ester carboxylesterase